MSDENPEINDPLKLAKAKLALSGEEKVTSWQKTSEDFEKRRAEAARAMASDEQKKAWAEAEAARLAKTEAQKKLADLELARKQTEEEKRSNLSQEQIKKDAEEEARRVAKVQEILRSQQEIDLIKKNPTAGPAPIRTLTRDISEAIGREGLSASKIITQTPNQEDFSKRGSDGKNRSWLAGISIVLVIAGLIAIVWAVGQRQVSSLAPTVITRQGLLFSDQQIAIDLDKLGTEQIRQELLARSLATTTGKEGWQEIYFTYQTKEQSATGLVTKMTEANPTLVAEKVNLGLPDQFLRFLEPKLMLGIYSAEGNTPFYIFKTKNYKNVASALLGNENLILGELLAPFSNASTTERIKSSPVQDKMVSNYDTRLILGEANNVIAIYSWLDKETVVFTTNENTFIKVLGAYSSR